jgi:hypothetical protein
MLAQSQDDFFLLEQPWIIEYFSCLFPSSSQVRMQASQGKSAPERFESWIGTE